MRNLRAGLETELYAAINRKLSGIVDFLCPLDAMTMSPAQIRYRRLEAIGIHEAKTLGEISARALYDIDQARFQL